MGRSVGTVFADLTIASAVNVSIYPLSGGSGSCGAMDDVEACALDATGCVGGCSGDAAKKVTAFISCLEQGWSENNCPGGDAKGRTCLQTADIDADAYDKCRADSTHISDIHRFIDDAGSFVTMFPKVIIGGHSSMFPPEAPDEIREALCDAGVTAACGTVMV